MDMFGVRFEFMFKRGNSFFFICLIFVIVFFDSLDVYILEF